MPQCLLQIKRTAKNQRIPIMHNIKQELQTLIQSINN